MQTRKKRDAGTMEGKDFIGFSREWTGHCPAKGRRNYKSALNSFIRFLGKETLAVSDMTPLLLYEYMDYLKKKEEERDKKLRQSGKRVPSHRAASLYMGSLRHLFREMRLMHEVSWDGSPFPWRDPFAMVRMPRQEAARKRALPPDVIRRIYGLPYEETHEGDGRENRHDLAKDCFLLSFCLIGMNSADLYGCTEYMDGSIAYHRVKTRDRRGDGARMVVHVPAVIEGIFRSHMDVTGERVFDFHRHYSTASSFNRAINLGLKRIGSILGIEDLEYYAARHSWATIAYNRCGIDKYTIHSALNHVDETMRVTDIYIERDFAVENEANAKVMGYVFGNPLPHTSDDKHETIEH